MRYLTWIIIAAILIGIHVFLPRPGSACSCYGINPPLIEFNQHDAVFTAFVVDAKFSPVPGVLDITLRATRSWKGVTQPIVHLYTPSSDAWCGYPFSLNTEFLIYASHGLFNWWPGLETHLCTRTKPLYAAQEDLAVLGAPVLVPVETATWGMIKALYKE